MKKSIIALVFLISFSGISFPQDISDDAWIRGNVDAQADLLRLAFNKIAVETFNPVMVGSVDSTVDMFARQAPFAIGSGNAHAMNVSSFPTVNFGVGIGATVSTLNPAALINTVVDNANQFTSNLTELESFGNISPDFFSSFLTVATETPIPYYSFYFKIGLPESTQFLSKFPIDIGFRVGFIPNAGALLPDSLGTATLRFETAGFNFGLESRIGLVKHGIFHIDFRMSADFNYRKIKVGSAVFQPVVSRKTENTVLVNEDGSNVSGGDTVTQILGDFTYQTSLSPDFTYSWNGFVFSPRIFTGIDIPVIGGVYAGIGPDINFGRIDASINMGINYKTTVSNITFVDPSQEGIYSNEANAAMGVREGSVMATSGVVSRSFDVYDVRVITGLQVFFMNISLEYGIFSKSFAITLHPFAVAF